MAHADIRAVNLNLLAAFDALLEERSVTRAASKMGVTQSAMSS
ncbi:MAG TPA: LysR family transcriptional regulator, partial [Polyangiaceae bacterium]|nr:LysR family transcriptional regulator [Polyangiaceae bacterium]